MSPPPDPEFRVRDKIVVNGTTYYYTAFAYDEVPNYSAGANASATPRQPFFAEGLDREVLLTWEAVPNATGYNLYWSTISGVPPGTGTLIGGIAASPYRHTGLTNGTTYYYVLTTIFSGSESTAGEMRSATPLIPARAARIVAGFENTCALLEDGSAKCWGRNYYGQLGQGDRNNRGDDPDEMGDNLPAINLGSPSGLRGVNTAPTNLATAAGDTRVKLSWDSVPGVSGYKIYYATGPGVTSATGTLAASVTTATYLHTGLANGTTLHYVITAFDTQLESPDSAEASATPAP